MIFNNESQKGQSLLEVIVAMAIFSLIAVVMVSIITGSFIGLTKGGQHTEAQAIAQEGIEAVRSLKDSNWDLIEGYTETGIEILGNNWVVKGEGTNDLIGNFVRTIYFNDVYRDDNYEIVPSNTLGALLDPKTKEVKSEVVWSPRDTIINIVNQISYLTNWEEVNESSCLKINTSTACFDRKILTGINLENTCSNEITIIGTIPIWNNTNQITWVEIDGENRWRSSCNWGCTPMGKQDSDTFLNFGNRILVVPGNSTITVNRYEWRNDMVGSIISILLKFKDLTNASALSFEPFNCNDPGGNPIITCDDYCKSINYTIGTCRQNASQCDRNDELYESIGDSYCTGGASADTCCCAP